MAMFLFAPSNWHIIIIHCISFRYTTKCLHIYTHCEMITTIKFSHQPSPLKISKKLFSCDENFEDLPSWQLHIHTNNTTNDSLLLNTMSPQPSYLLAKILYLPPNSTHFICPPLQTPPIWQPPLFLCVHGVLLCLLDSSYIWDHLSYSVWLIT